MRLGRIERQGAHKLTTPVLLVLLYATARSLLPRGRVRSPRQWIPGVAVAAALAGSGGPARADNYLDVRSTAFAGEVVAPCIFSPCDPPIVAGGVLVQAELRHVFQNGLVLGADAGPVGLGAKANSGGVIVWPSWWRAVVGYWRGSFGVDLGPGVLLTLAESGACFARCG